MGQTQTKLQIEDIFRFQWISLIISHQLEVGVVFYYRTLVITEQEANTYMQTDMGHMGSVCVVSDSISPQPTCSTDQCTLGYGRAMEEHFGIVTQWQNASF